MAVVWVHEVGQPSAGRDLTARFLERHFQVRVDSVNDSPLVAETASAGGISIPQRGQTHPTLSTLRVQESDIKQTPTKEGWLYDIFILYSSRVFETTPDPLNDETKIFYDKVEIPVVMTHAWNRATSRYDIPFLNSAAHPFDDAPDDIDYRRVLRFVRNESVFDDITGRQLGTFQGTVNSDSWFGYAPGEVLCTGITGERFVNPASVLGEFYFQITYEFLVARNRLGRTSTAPRLPGGPFPQSVPVSGHGLYMEDRGPHWVEWNNSTNEWDQVKFIDKKNGLELPSGLLNGAGGELQAVAGQLRPIYIVFEVKQPKAFAPLNLET